MQGLGVEARRVLGVPAVAGALVEGEAGGGYGFGQGANVGERDARVDLAGHDQHRGGDPADAVAVGVAGRVGSLPVDHVSAHSKSVKFHDVGSTKKVLSIGLTQ
jgi:hypothetical protein